MKNLFRFGISSLLAVVLIAQSPFTFAGNLVAGVGPVNSIGNWSNYSAVNLIAGATLLPSTSKTTVLYVAFTAGTTADISNMVLYKTASHSTKILTVTPVALASNSSPMIDLTNKKTCKTQPVSAANPCLVKLDPITLALSPGNDYYFVIYFASNTNNSSLGGGSPAFSTSSLTGYYVSADETQLKVGNQVPTIGFTAPYFLVAVQTS